MQKNNRSKSLSFLLCMALIVAMALFTAGCNGSTKTPAGQGGQTDAGQSSPGQADAGQNSPGQADAGQNTPAPQEGITRLGEGSVQFAFTVADKDGNETAFEIHTDKETVGDALLELGLIAGEEGEYGLYVKTVNGITADYDKDGVYWAFYVNGEYALTGVDSTKITEGESYSFRVE